jgi:D-glycero-D-manno-heptose 1,7-bisphosphate phosphatase
MVLAGSGAIFLDRDGVINENRPEHVKNWDEFEFLPQALESIRRLTETGLPIFIVTNQAIVCRGIVTDGEIQAIHRRMMTEIEAAGGRIEKVYYCPHDNDANCRCRKPNPGMLEAAAAEYGIDLSKSFIVGDAWTDVEAGLSVNSSAILVMTGRGRGQGNLARCLIQYPVRFGAAVDLADATTMINSALKGEPMTTTPRMRGAFHMALSPHELTVL